MNRNVVFSLAMLLLCGIAFAETFNFPEGSRFRAGPETYPRIILGAMAALSVLLLVKSLIREGVGFGPAAFRPGPFLAKYAKSIAIFVLFGLHVLFLPIVGFAASTVVFLVVLQFILKASYSVKSVCVVLAVAVGSTAFIQIIFTNVLGVLLP